MAAVDKLITERLSSKVVLINQLGHYIVGSGGKRLRPALVLLSARANAYEGDAHISLAAIVEFIHTATLLHDDVVDESNMRRGRDTANRVWGNNASVLVGDFLYSRAFQMMVELGDMRVMDIMADTTNLIAEGEVMQLVNCQDPDTTEERYLDVIRCKTAKLFEAATELGAVVARRPIEEQQALAVYGLNFGIAFQLIDDVLDYSAQAEELGKNLGDDLAEGKPTLPLLYAMWNGTPVQSALVREAIEKGGLDNIAAITSAIESTGAIAYTAELARRHAATAKEALALLPDSSHKQAMLGLADFAVERRS
jgi:octaprenyl-diphosphate synthase